MRSHSVHVFDHPAAAYLPSFQLVRQRLGSSVQRVVRPAAATLLTLIAAGVLGVLALLLKR